MRQAGILLLPLFLLGNADRNCPEDMVRVPNSSVCIDRYEWPNKPGVRPLVGASALPSPWDMEKGIVMDAASLCASVEKRMCKMGEWVTSCRGPNNSDYPFGSQLPKRRPDPDEAPCNYAQWFKEPDYALIFKRDVHEMKRLDQSDPSGERGCVSASGAEDMMGNVEEWIECPSWMSNNCSGPPENQTCFCLAGRYWSSPEPCHKMITGHAPIYYDYETGFRCCKDLK